MKLRFAALLIAMLALTLLGCQGGITAPPAYKVANANRLTAVRPRLQAYAATQPATEQQTVSDLLKSWQAEVTAQQQP